MRSNVSKGYRGPVIHYAQMYRDGLETFCGLKDPVAWTQDVRSVDCKKCLRELEQSYEPGELARIRRAPRSVSTGHTVKTYDRNPSTDRPWVITLDVEGSGVPRGIYMEDAPKSSGNAFMLYDDDNVLLYRGRLYYGDEFAPLYWAERHVGATIIKYYNARTRKWETL